jgi:hypothetical protein
MSCLLFIIPYDGLNTANIGFSLADGQSAENDMKEFFSVDNIASQMEVRKCKCLTSVKFRLTLDNLLYRRYTTSKLLVRSRESYFWRINMYNHDLDTFRSVAKTGSFKEAMMLEK